MISCTVTAGDNAPAWDISELAFPEKAVIWEWGIWCQDQGVYMASVRLALGDQLPASAAMMNGLEPMIPGLGATGAEPRYITAMGFSGIRFNNVRIPLAAGGRRLVLEATGVPAKTPVCGAGVVVSGVPQEVPWWLISETDRERL